MMVWLKLLIGGLNTSLAKRFEESKMLVIYYASAGYI